jgi:hypothetical protein
VACIGSKFKESVLLRHPDHQMSELPGGCGALVTFVSFLSVFLSAGWPLNCRHNNEFRPHSTGLRVNIKSWTLYNVSYKFVSMREIEIWGS